MENKQIDIMSNAPVGKAILKLSIPVVCGMMVQVFYNLVDTFFIGRLNDENQLAAANISSPIFMLLMAVATIVSTGAASYISRCLGKKDYKNANRTLNTGILICIIMAIIIMVLGLIFARPLVIGLGASENVFPYAFQYVVTMLLGSIPVMLNYTGGQLLRSEGAVMPSIIGMIIGAVSNIILDPIFIFTFNMGILGAGIATVIGNTLSMIFYIGFYMCGKSLLKIRPSFISADKIIWKEIFSIGIPACLSQLLAGIALIVLNNQAKQYGDVVLAAMGISAKLIFIGTFVFMGFAAGCQPLVGFNYGAKNFTRVIKIFRVGMLMTFTIGLVLAIIFWICANAMVSCFTDISDVVVQGTKIFQINVFSFLVLGPQMLASTGIQAFGKAKESLLLSIARQGIVYVPLLFIMQALCGFDGLIWAQPIADMITLLIGLVILISILRQIMKSKDDVVQSDKI